MTHSGKKSHAILTQLVLIGGLLSFGPYVSVTQAQLSRCTHLQLQQGATRCEKPAISSGSSLESIPGVPRSTGPAIGKEATTGLAKPRSYSVPPLDLSPESFKPPSNDVRDYLNRQDPAHAIHPIEPRTSPPSPVP